MYKLVLAQTVKGIVKLPNWRHGRANDHDDQIIMTNSSTEGSQGSRSGTDEASDRETRYRCYSSFSPWKYSVYYSPRLGRRGRGGTARPYHSRDQQISV